MSDTALASYKQRVGSRYYKVDEGYDKRVYENTWQNYVKICVVFLFFYTFMSLHWWGCFEYGIYDTEGYTIYSIAIFCASIVMLGGMLTSGKYANYNKRHHLFLEEIIAEKRASKAEELERKNQELLYKQKLAKKQAADATRV